MMTTLSQSEPSRTSKIPITRKCVKCSPEIDKYHLRVTNTSFYGECSKSSNLNSSDYTKLLLFRLIDLINYFYIFITWLLSVNFFNIFFFNCTNNLEGNKQNKYNNIM